MWIFGAIGGIGAFGLLSWCIAGNSLTTMALSALLNLATLRTPEILNGPIFDFALSLALFISPEVKDFFQGLILGHIPFFQEQLGRLVFKGGTFSVGLIFLFFVYLHLVPQNTNRPLEPTNPLAGAIPLSTTNQASSNLSNILASGWLALFLLFLYRSLPEQTEELPEGKSSDPDLRWYSFPANPSICIIHRVVPWRQNTEVFDIFAPSRQRHSSLAAIRKRPNDSDSTLTEESNDSTNSQIRVRYANVIKKPKGATAYRVNLGRDLSSPFTVPLQFGSFSLTVQTSLSVTSKIDGVDLSELDAHLLTDPEKTVPLYQAKLGKLLNQTLADITKKGMPDGLIELLFAMSKMRAKQGSVFYEAGAQALDGINKFENHIRQKLLAKSEQIFGNLVTVDLSVKSFTIDENRWKAMQTNLELVGQAADVGHKLDENARKEMESISKFLSDVKDFIPPGIAIQEVLNPIISAINQVLNRLGGNTPELDNNKNDDNDDNDDNDNDDNDDNDNDKRNKYNDDNGRKNDTKPDSSGDEVPEDTDGPNKNRATNKTKKIDVKILAEAQKELDDMIGLAEVKNQVANLVDHLKMNQLRAAQGLRNPTITHHLVFLGPPGTGKTQVARIVGKIYRAMGIVSNGHVVESARKDLVGQYLGQTAPKTAKMVRKAKGGILFIDEAYALSPPDGRDFFAQEAIDTLLKMMEDMREDLVVIVAGYEAQMLGFLATNPGLDSRFPTKIKFPRYDTDDLIKIFLKFAADSDYSAAPDIEPSLVDLIEKEVKSKGTSFGNARFIRNVFDKAIVQQSRRLASNPRPTKAELRQILIADLCNL
jgi:stage V sporulation protein K